MANPQPTDAHLRIAHSISEEIMMRDFTKRQRSILDLILRLSWGCAKKYAIVPKLKYFELCGVPNTKVKVELDFLVNARVIFWESEMNRYWFNKNYDEWKISIVKQYDRNLLDELIHLNLKNYTSQNGNIVPETETNFPKQEESSRQEVGTKFPKRELFEGSNEVISTDEEVSKESIKESTTTTITTEESLSDEYVDTVDNLEVDADSTQGLDKIERHYAANVLQRASVGSKDMQIILEAYKKYPVDFIIECMDRAVEKYKLNNDGIVNIKSFKYFEPILKDEWDKKLFREAGEKIHPEPPSMPTRQASTSKRTAPTKTSNRFHNFEQRTAKYSKEELEQMLLGKNTSV